MNLKKHCFSLTHCVIFYFTRGILSENYLSVQWTVGHALRKHGKSTNNTHSSTRRCAVHGEGEKNTYKDYLHERRILVLGSILIFIQPKILIEHLSFASETRFKLNL